MIAITSFSQAKGKFTDSRDGKIYKTVVIGTQTWMAENLNVSAFRNGDPIPEAKTDEEWVRACNQFQPAWCYYKNNDNLGPKYGKLYNWWAIIDSREISPIGWRIPNSNDLKVLTNYTGSDGFDLFYGQNVKVFGSIPIYKTEISYKKTPSHPEEIYSSCSNCSYWTKKQKENNPCPKCRNKGFYYIKTGKIIPEKNEKIENKKLISGFKEGEDRFGLNIYPTGRRTKSGFNYADTNSFTKGAFFWITDFSSNSSDFGSSFSIGASEEIDKYSGYSIRCLEGDLLYNKSEKNIYPKRSYEYAITADQYASLYDSLEIRQIKDFIFDYTTNEMDNKYISIKSDFLCDYTNCCGFLEYIYSGSDGKDNIIGYKISVKNENGDSKMYLSSLSASTSQYDKYIEQVNSVELIKISDLLYKSADGKYLIQFLFTNYRCNKSDMPKNNFHLRVIDDSKKYFAYSLEWLEILGGAHWSGGGSSFSGHNQNWAFNQVLTFLNFDLSKKNDSSANLENKISNEIKKLPPTRKRLIDPVLPNYSTNQYIKIHLELTINSNGEVVDAKYVESYSICSKKKILEDVIYQIKKQVKYSKDPTSPYSITYITIEIEP
jgi:uncharacterized protein (TIGR02145 family)